MTLYVFLIFKQDTILRIREIFSILTQGVEMVYYEIDSTTNQAPAAKMIVWMVSCVSSATYD